jgi:hypothetical protein
MFQRVIALIQASRGLQLALALLGGMAIGALMYPTRHIEEKLSKTHEQEIATLNQQHQSELQSEKDSYSKLSGQFTQYQQESSAKISSLTTQVSTLSSHKKTAMYKVVHPDGTIEEKEFTSSDIDESNKVVTSVQQEFQTKINSIEKKWEDIHQQRVAELQKEYDSKEQTYKQTIDTLQKSKVETINPKNFGLEAGVLANKDYYTHVTYDVFGPFFIGLQGQFGTTDSTAGVGVGIRF